MIKARGSDIYFFEGFSPALFSFVIKRKNNKLIVKANDQLPYHFLNNKIFKYLFKMSGMERNIDGVLAVSDMVKDDYQKLFNLKKIVVCEGFIYRDSQELTGEADNNNKDFIFIGEDGYIKGLEFAVDAFLYLKKNIERYSDSSFYIIGGVKDYIVDKKMDLKSLEANDIVFIDYTVDVFPYIRKARYQLHFARYEPNAVSIMECMSLGVIPLISDTTGNKTFIADICNDLILDPIAESFHEDLIQAISKVEENYAEIKRNFVIQAKERYSKEAGVERWTRGYKELLND